MRDKGNYPCLSEDWLIKNLPEGWNYDCVMATDHDEQDGFKILAPGMDYEDDCLFIPLDLLVQQREGWAEAWYIHKYQVWQDFGGHEEGGWWFPCGEPVKDWEARKVYDKEDAYGLCRELNAEERERASKEEDYGYSSVLAHRSTHYEYSVTDSPIAESFPKVRPHYE